jgi:hypothetical protein
MTLTVSAWISPTVICSACGEKIEVGHDLLRALWDLLFHKYSSSGFALIQSSVTNALRGVSKKLGEWYQKTKKTEDTNKLTSLAFKIITILHNTLSATFIKLLETVSKGLFRNRPQNRCHTFLDCRHVCKTCAFHDALQSVKHGRGMACVNQTRPHCVNQMGKKNNLKPYRHGMAGERHGNGMVCVN